MCVKERQIGTITKYCMKINRMQKIRHSKEKKALQTPKNSVKETLDCRKVGTGSVYRPEKSAFLYQFLPYSCLLDLRPGYRPMETDKIRYKMFEKTFWIPLTRQESMLSHFTLDRPRQPEVRFSSPETRGGVSSALRKKVSA